MSINAVCCGYLTKSPTKGGCGRWRLRWVELIDSRKEEGGNLRVEYFSSDKKKKKPLGVVSLDKCVGIRELRSENGSSRFTYAFSILFSDRSDFILSSYTQSDIHRWMMSVKNCGISILLSIAGDQTLLRAVSPSPSELTDSYTDSYTDKKEESTNFLEVDYTTRKLPSAPPPLVRQKQAIGETVSSSLYLRAEEPTEDLNSDYQEADHYYSHVRFWTQEDPTRTDEMKRHMKILSQPVFQKKRIQPIRQQSLLVEPAPNLVALRAQLKKFRVQEVTEDRLKITSHITDGGFGAISVATLDGVPVAVKELKLTSTEEEETAFLRETFIISQFNQANIVKVVGVVLTGQMMMVLELLSTTSLKDHLTAKYKGEEFNQDDLIKYSLEVAVGMRYMHTMGYIHKRLRAEHILMSSDNEHCKIAGFNESTEKAEFTKTCSGWKLRDDRYGIWMAIEVLKKHQHQYSPESDVWSYGVLLYEIWSVGRLPYQGCTHKKLLETLNAFQCEPPPPGCPRSLYKIMTKCWYHKPSKRPTWPAILDTLKSPDMNLVLGTYDNGTKLLPESLKLGASNLNCAKLLHMDLQTEYTEVQKQELAEILKREKLKSKNRFHMLKNMFGRVAAKEDIKLEQNSAYSLMVMSGSADSKLSDALDLYEPLSIYDAVEADDVDGYVPVEPPKAMGRKMSRKKTKKGFPALKSSSSLSQLSKSCESLSPYEAVDVVSVTLSESVETRLAVHKLVRQFESTSALHLTATALTL